MFTKNELSDGVNNRSHDRQNRSGGENMNRPKYPTSLMRHTQKMERAIDDQVMEAKDEKGGGSK